VAERYRELAAAEPSRYAVIDAAGAPQEIHAAVLERVLALPEAKGMRR
jgi:thymidylate kinase